MAWFVGEGIIIYRTYKAEKAPPGPGQLLWTSGIFVLLALLAEGQKTRALATTLAWGFDIAAMLNLFQTGVAKMDTHWPPPKLGDDVIFPGGPTGPKKDLNPVAPGPIPDERKKLSGPV